MTASSPGQSLKRKIKTLDRRIDYLESKRDQNSWDKAEMAALELAVEVIERHHDTAIAVIQEFRQGIG